MIDNVDNNMLLEQMEVMHNIQVFQQVGLDISKTNGFKLRRYSDGIKR